MFALLFKLIPLQDYLYIAIILAGGVFWVHHDHVEQKLGAARITAAVNAATQKAEGAARVQIAALNQQYASNLAKVSTSYEDQLSAATAEHTTDLQRLREYDAYRKSHPSAALGSSSASAAPAVSGPPSVSDVGVSIENAAVGLAEALRLDDAQLQKCWAERDSLTGL
jgi:hypothetical protein